MASITACDAGEKTMNPEIFVEQSLNGLRAKTAAHSGTWQLDKALQRSTDLDTGTLVSTLQGGMIASAPCQIVGSYDGEDGAFLWGWDHPSVPDALRKHAQLAREWGEKHGMTDYTTLQIECSEEKVWEFTAVAA